MGLSEGYFWESTPRKIIALIDQKKQIEKARTKNLAIYIACMVWGKDPDEMQADKNAPIAGRDFPASESALKGFFM
jgi:hypothetical protein